ncbi:MULTISPECIES: DUF1643 domain-containing protein [Lactococcus]|uniref:DUF1643 domain-containing protein n=1 Tax=Lactococcus TaxID=1357 RepID=UPI00289178FC|nr:MULTISPECIES: DUF1643 domain-containing protein [Lactococcus]MDT2563434.1 DUF1643 domain-containing protein [Lactococcus petauri]MDT2874163.1 DUF1643 domain-containing protein [Lactococcus lactis]MDT2925560.1 DUF1643 domain-containing protein [Lactococcus lactis]MDT2936047.1 DUF1643 domain-containing protein [Lactococcus lactis]MDT2952681.1 DUF1643 domain-containing protein [Lactococcus lactis]
MSFNYPTGYKAESVLSESQNCRYALKITTPATSSPITLFVLMMNPSVADGRKSDKTIDTLIKYYGEKYRQIIVVNTTPVIETDSNNLKNRINDINKNKMANTRSVSRMVKEAGSFHFLIATGEVKKGINDAAYVDLMNHIDNITVGDALFVISLTSKGFGGHPLYKKAEQLQNLTLVRKSDEFWHLEKV